MIRRPHPFRRESRRADRRLYRGALATLALTSLSLTGSLAGCATHEVSDVATYTSVAPPQGVTPTVAADPTQAQATEMARAKLSDSKEISTYVALGDSYAAMGSRKGNKADPGFCARAKDNYPNVLAGMLGRSVTFIDATCQGSKTDNISGPRVEPDHDFETGPQMDELPSDADLITLSLGGNDMDFAGIAHCLQDVIGGVNRDCGQEFAIPTAQNLAELPGKLTRVHQEIKKKAPNAVVVATGYMPILNTEYSCEYNDVIGTDGVEWAVWLTAAINNVVKQTAEANGAIFVLPDNVEQHGACASPKARWVDVWGEQTNSYPAHPTPNGQRAMAMAMRDVVKG